MQAGLRAAIVYSSLPIGCMSFAPAQGDLS